MDIFSKCIMPIILSAINPLSPLLSFFPKFDVGHVALVIDYDTNEIMRVDMI